MFVHLQVTLLDTLELAHYTIRTMRLQHRGSTEVRDVRHLQYTAWPDHGVPDHPTPFLMFLKRVKTLNQPGAGPIISHCRFVSSPSFDEHFKEQAVFMSKIM